MLGIYGVFLQIQAAEDKDFLAVGFYLKDKRLIFFRKGSVE